MSLAEIPIKCIHRHQGGKWDIGDLQGEGSYGQVYEACRDEECDHVMKIMRFKNKASFLLEVRTQEEAADVGIAVPIVDHWICSGTSQGIMVMPRLEITVFDYINQNDLYEDELETLKEALLQLMHQFHELGYGHNDLHLSNVMMIETYDRQSRYGVYWQDEARHLYRLYLVDFGSALPFEGSHVEPEVYQQNDRDDLLKSFREATGAL